MDPQLSYIQKLSSALTSQFPQSEAFLVGGAVRDLIMKRELGDLDVVVRGVPIQKLIAFLKTQGKANLVGKNFGVIKFTPKGSDKSLDIALPRTDHAFNTGGYRDVKVAYDHTLPIEKDLERRDFTCNSIALRLNHKPQTTNHKQVPNSKSKTLKTIHYSLITNHSSLIDPFGGLSDIKKQTIRAVGNPEKRFKEDYTRMLRALRFSCQLGFEIEKKTWGSIKKNVRKINEGLKVVKSESRKVEFKIARELVAKEFLKGTYHDPIQMLELMDKSGLLKELIPELLTLKSCKQDAKWHSEGNVWTHTMLALQLAHTFCHSRLDRESKQQKQKRKEFKSFGFYFDFLDPVSKHGMTTQEILELYLGILFHDIGKPSTAGHEKKNDTKAITYYGHETVGAEMTRAIGNRLKLSAHEEFRVDVDRVVWLVRNHMLMHPENAKQMKNNTLEKYFFNPLVPGSALLGLCFFDGLSSIPKTRKGMYARYQSFLANHKPFPLTLNQLKTWISIEGWWTITARLKKLSKGRKELPAPLLNGNEIMKLLNIKPGPDVGKTIERLREAQLAGKVNNIEQAKQFIKKRIS